MNDADGCEIELHDAGGVGQARLEAQGLAQRLGLLGEAADRLVLVVSELATNLVVHGSGGTISLQPGQGSVVVVTASALAGDASGAARARLGQDLPLVRRLASSVAVQPGQRITAVVALGRGPRSRR